MSIAIAGILVIITLLLAAMLTFGAVLTTTTNQAASLREASGARVDRVTGALSITSTSTGAAVGGTNITVVVGNTGAVSYSGEASSGDFSHVDFLTEYTDSTGDKLVKRLTYVCKSLCNVAGSPGDNEWTITGISPDSYNPDIWDPDETATISSKVAPAIGGSTTATVAVVVPGGVSDTASVSN